MHINIAVIFHSGYGHTTRVAECIAEGANQVSGTEVHLINVEHFHADDWDLLDHADAIIFGAPTYMGSVSAPFKQFMDSTSKRWVSQRWKDKVAGGFTNSGAFCGDKLSTLMQIVLFTMQHSMVWVGTGQMIEKEDREGEPTPNDINRLGSYLGVMTFAGNDTPEVTPPHGDLETSRRYGRRIAEKTRLLAGKK